MDIRDAKLREFAFEGNFGLERESLRVTGEGRFATTPHPFPDSPQIVRDFCENQTEINTRVHPSASAAVAELRAIDAEIRRALAELPDPEWLWPFSNPPPITDNADVRPAVFGGPLAGKSAYRDYLAAKYGLRLMTFCGIHFNFSFGERLLDAAARAEGAADGSAFRDGLYLRVAEQLLVWGWVIVPLTAASPLLDATFLHNGSSGDADAGMASVRCSELGYWNFFTPVLDFSSVGAYAESISRLVQDGLIAAPSELYYPIRLKPRGPNRLAELASKGVDHLEVRCLDLNPFTGGLIDERDVVFIQLLILWCAGRPSPPLAARDQVQAVRNFKNAARYDLESAEILLPDGRHGTVRRAGLAVLDHLDGFYAGFPDWVQSVLSFERGKLEHPESRYAERVRRDFGGTFARKGLAFARQAGQP